jgi:proteasome lid subunit RPN8/RPN11
MLKIPRNIVDEIRRQAAREYPEECCGVLIGRATPRSQDGLQEDDRVVVEAIACRNLRAGSGTRYAIAPHELVAAQRGARERGLAIVGFYHSHPDHAAVPSRTDVAEANWPDCAYLIVPVTQHGAGEFKAYFMGPNTGYKPEALDLFG